MYEVIISVVVTFLVVYSLAATYLTVRVYRSGVKVINTVERQGVYITAISEIISSSKEELGRLDKLGAFQSDDETGRFFESMKEVQGILNAFILDKDGEKKKN